MKRWQWLVILAMVLAVGFSVLYLWQSPRLVDFTPGDGVTAQANSELRLVFSRTMRPDSVQAHLKITPAQTGTFRWQGKTLIFTPDEFWPAGKEIRVELLQGAQGAGWLSFTTYRQMSWSFLVGQPRLVYLYPADGSANLYAASLPTAVDQPLEAQRLTDLASGILDFDVTADGREIYFSVKGNQQDSAIYRLDLTSQPALEAVLVLDCPKALCQAVTVSAQGDTLAYERTDYTAADRLAYPQVWWAALPARSDVEAAAAVPELQPRLAGAALHQTVQPDWSSAGQLIYYDITLAAFVIFDPHSGLTWQFANQTGQPGSWNPAGTDYVVPEIFITEGRNSNLAPDVNSFGNSRLIRFIPLGSAQQDLTGAADLEDTAPVYSPDGAYLAFARKYLDTTLDPGRQLWLMQADGQGARPLTNDPTFNYFDFAWSPGGMTQPAGDWIACVRFNQTNPVEPLELWVVDSLTGRGIRLLTGAYAPQWLP